MCVLAALCAPLHTRTAGSNRSSAGGARLRTPGPARLGCAPAPGARGQVGNMRTGGMRDFRKIFPVLLFSCRRGPRTRRLLPRPRSGGTTSGGIRNGESPRRWRLRRGRSFEIMNDRVYEKGRRDEEPASRFRPHSRGIRGRDHLLFAGWRRCGRGDAGGAEVLDPEDPGRKPVGDGCPSPRHLPPVRPFAEGRGRERRAAFQRGRRAAQRDGKSRGRGDRRRRTVRMHPHRGAVPPRGPHIHGRREPVGRCAGLPHQRPGGELRRLELRGAGFQPAERRPGEPNRGQPLRAGEDLRHAVLGHLGRCGRRGAQGRERVPRQRLHVRRRRDHGRRRRGVRGQGRAERRGDELHVPER